MYWPGLSAPFSLYLICGHLGLKRFSFPTHALSRAFFSFIDEFLSDLSFISAFDIGWGESAFVFLNIWRCLARG